MIINKNYREKGKLKKENHITGEIEELSGELEMVKCFWQRYYPGEDIPINFNDIRLQRLLEKTIILKRRIDNYQGDWKFAFSEAEAEVAKYQKLMEYQKSSVLSRNFLVKSILIPSILIFLTALLGNWVGTSLQESSFKRRQVFELTLEQLKSGRDIAVDITTKVREIYLDIVAFEGRYKNDKNKKIFGRKSVLPILLFQYQRLETLQTKTSHIKNEYGIRIRIAINQAKKNMQKLSDCLKMPKGNADCIGMPQPNNPVEKASFDEEYLEFFSAFENVVEAYSEAIIHSLDDN